MGLPNGQNLQDLFNQRFGANAYQNGVNSAQQAGQNYYNSLMQAKIQAQMQQDFINQQKQQAALQKPINDQKNAADYWNQNKDALLQKGAYRAVQDLQNDPELQAQLKAQGYDVKALADQAYNVATGGKIKSASGFKDFYNSVNPDAATRKANQQSIQDVMDQNAAKDAQAKIDAQNKANYDSSWYGKLLNGIGSGLNDAGNAIGGAVGDVGKNIGNEYNKVTNDPQGLGHGLYNAGGDFFNGLAELGNRFDNQSTKTLLGQGMLDKEHQQQQNLLNQLKLNPNNAALAQTNQNIFNQSNSQAKTGLDQLANLTGGFAGNVAPYLVGDGLLGAASKIGKVGELGNIISNPLANKVAGGALSGAVGGGLVSGAQALGGENQSAGDVMKNILENAAIGGGASAILNGGAQKLLQQLNLKGQAEKMMQGTGSTKFDPTTFEQVIKDATQTQLQPNDVLKFAPGGTPQARSLIGDVKLPENQSGSISNIADQALNKQPANVSNNNWFSPNALQEHPMVNFAQQGSNIPQGRGILQDLSVPKAQSGPIRSLAEDTLNKANAFTNAPAEGFNQRLLNVQQEMKGLQNNAQTLADHNGGSYAPNADNLYQQVRKPSDPKTFDDLVKMAQMEHNSATAPSKLSPGPNIKQYLEADPRFGQQVRQQLDVLNALGKPSKQASKLIPDIASKNKGLNIPELKGTKQAPKDLLQGLYTDRGAKPSGKAPSGNGDLLTSLKPGKGMPKLGDVMKSLTDQKKYVLDTVKIDKNISLMSKKELQDAATKLENQHELVSKGGKGSAERLKAIEADMAKIKQAGLKFDLQFFGEGAKANPIEAVREKLFGKTPDKTPQDIAREKAQVKSAFNKLDEKSSNKTMRGNSIQPNSKDAKLLDAFSNKKISLDELKQKSPKNWENIVNADKAIKEKGAPLSEKSIQELQTMKDIKPWQKQTLSSYDLFKKLPSEIGDRLTKLFDKAKSGRVEHFMHGREDIYNKVVQDLGIKKGSKESGLVQDYGEKTLGKKALEEQGKDPEKVSKEELNKANEAELNRLAGDKADKYRAADKYARDFYHQEVSKVNAEKAKIYPNQPDKLVPIREDYYHHFNELHGFDNFKNVLERNHGIDPHLAGLSQDTKPKTKWAAPWQKRGNGEYKSDAVGGMLRYLQASSYATHIDPFIKELRDTAEHMATVREGIPSENHAKAALNMRADELAGKTHEWDRAAQGMMGRKAWNVVNTVNSHIKKNKIVGNLGSFLGVTGNVPGIVGVTKGYAAKGLPFAMKDWFSAALDHGKITGPMAESKFLKERYMNEGNNKFETNPLKKAENGAGHIIEAGDKAASYLAWHASYQQALGKGLEGKNAVNFADKQAMHLLGGRGVGERPLYQTAKMTHIISPFTLEVTQLTKVLGKQLKTKDYGGLATFLVGAALYNHVIKTVRGSGAGYDPAGAALEGWNDKKNLTTGDKIHGALSNALGDTVGQIPGASNLVKGLGITKPADKKFWFGDRSPDRFGSGTGAITDILKPIMDLKGGDLKSTALDSLPILMPFGGSQAAKTIKGGMALAQGGVSNKAGNLEYPVNRSNPLDAARALMFGPAATSTGQKYFNEHETALSPKDTQAVQNGLKNYDSVMQQRAQNAIKTQIAKVRNDKTLDPNQKLQQIAILMQKMQQGK